MQVVKPFHRGELLVQEQAGDRTAAERSGAIVSDTILAGALPFLRQQELFFLGSASSRGELWASVLFGPKSFLDPADGKVLRIQLGAIDLADPLWENLAADRRVGGLAIEFATRRRLRINGRVIERRPDLLAIAVDETYPNCPRYIQRRVTSDDAAPSSPTVATGAGTSLTGAACEILAAADTLFVASANPDGGLDLSHRGGPPGFVTILDEASLSIPDYRGNGMFNTLGNLAINPRAGILVLDFQRRLVLQMTGAGQLHFKPPQAASPSPETGRRWTFTVERWLLRPLLAPLEFTLLEYSPYNPR